MFVSQLIVHSETKSTAVEAALFRQCLLINSSNMAAIRLFRQGMIRLVMTGCTGRMNMLSSLMANLAAVMGTSL